MTTKARNRIDAAWCAVILSGVLAAACGSHPSTSRLAGTGQGSDDFVLGTVEPTVQYRIRADDDAERRPLVVYYAVNQSEEPFMQLFVDRELQDLRRTCTPDAKSDWVAIVNSHVVHWQARKYLMCRDGQLQFADYGDVAAALPAIARHPVDRPESYASDEARVPLVDSDLMLSIANGLRATFSPADKYVWFFHLKAHGSNDLIATGLDATRLEAKRKPQIERLAALGAWHDGQTTLLPPGTEGLLPEDLEAHPELGLADATYELRSARTTIAATINDDVVAMLRTEATTPTPAPASNTLTSDGDHGGTLGSTPDRMLDAGGDRGSLGIEAGMLGAGAGLNAGNYWGLTPHDFTQTIGRILQRNPNDRSRSRFFGSAAPMGFIMIESCSTNFKFDLAQQIRGDAAKLFQDVGAYYAAQGSLWYANLTWGRLIDDAGGSISGLQSGLINLTGTITNALPKGE
jgi:hypothetical protein